MKENFKTTFSEIIVIFNHSKKKNLRKITSEILKILGDNSGDLHLDLLHSFVLDTTDTKLYASKTTIKKSFLHKYIVLIHSSEYCKF